MVLVYPYGIVVDCAGPGSSTRAPGSHETWETFARTIHFAIARPHAYAIPRTPSLTGIAGYVERHPPRVRRRAQAASIGELAALVGIAEQPLLETVASLTMPPRLAMLRASTPRADGLAAALVGRRLVQLVQALDWPPYLA